MKIVHVLLLCLLTSSLCYSQAGFPRLTLLDEQKVVILDMNQVKALNLLWNSYTECVAINSEQTLQLESYRELTDACDYREIKYKELVVVKDERIAERDILIKKYQDESKRSIRKERWMKTQRAVLGVVSLAAIGALIYTNNDDN